MPHQGIVSLSISVLSIILTMSLVVYTLRQEKQSQARNTTDEH